MEVAGAWFGGEEGLNGCGVVGDWKEVVRGRGSNKLGQERLTVVSVVQRTTMDGDGAVQTILWKQF